MGKAGSDQTAIACVEYITDKEQNRIMAKFFETEPLCAKIKLKQPTSLQESEFDELFKDADFTQQRLACAKQRPGV